MAVLQLPLNADDHRGWVSGIRRQKTQTKARAGSSVVFSNSAKHWILLTSNISDFEFWSTNRFWICSPSLILKCRTNQIWESGFEKIIFMQHDLNQILEIGTKKFDPAIDLLRWWSDLQLQQIWPTSSDKKISIQIRSKSSEMKMVAPTVGHHLLRLWHPIVRSKIDRKLIKKFSRLWYHVENPNFGWLN